MITPWLVSEAFLEEAKMTRRRETWRQAIQRILGWKDKPTKKAKRDDQSKKVYLPNRSQPLLMYSAFSAEEIRAVLITMGYAIDRCDMLISKDGQTITFRKARRRP